MFQRLCSSVAFLTVSIGVVAGSFAYDPMEVESSAKVKMVDLNVRDDVRKRDIPIRVYLPPSGNSNSTPAPVVLFSHGLGGTKNGNAYLGEHWARRGYVVVFTQHIGSDDSAWRDVALGQRMASLKEAASFQNFRHRTQDIPAVIDQLEKWNENGTNELLGRMDLARLGMSGHSFGAVTTQAVSGQSYPLGISFTDKRIKAAIPMSPSGARKGADPKQAFGAVIVPWLLMTGTKDLSVIGDQDLESRLRVFPGLTKGEHYQLVLDNAEHSAFSDRALPGDREKRNPNHHRAILALSTAFWDAYLKGDADAKKWLRGMGPRLVIESADKWEMR